MCKVPCDLTVLLFLQKTYNLYSVQCAYIVNFKIVERILFSIQSRISPPGKQLYTWGLRVWITFTGNRGQFIVRLCTVLYMGEVAQNLPESLSPESILSSNPFVSSKINASEGFSALAHCWQKWLFGALNFLKKLKLKEVWNEIFYFKFVSMNQFPPWSLNTLMGPF